MTRKQSGRKKVTLGKVPSNARKSKIRSGTNVPQYHPARNLSERSQEARARAFHVIADVRRAKEHGENLPVSQAADNRETTLRNVRKYAGLQLQQEHPGASLDVTSSDRERLKMQIPSTRPDVSIPIRTNNSRDRKLIGEWFAAVNEARDGKFERIHNFPKRQMIDGVLLPTGDFQIQRILEAMEQSEKPFETLYASTRAGAR